jgi:hypothetical protein
MKKLQAQGRKQSARVAIGWSEIASFEEYLD